MSEDRLDSLDPELVALLDAERAATAPVAALDRIWDRVATGAPVPGSPTSKLPVARTGSGWLATHAVGVAVATFVVGGLLGAGLHAAWSPRPAERIVYVDRPSAPPVASPAPSTPLPPSISSPTAPSPLASARPSTRPAAASSPSSLAAERAILDDARDALGSGDSPRALTLLDEHGRRFSHGQLVEEREALAIQALVTLGRNDDARARAARFRASTPHSLFMPAVDASLASIP